MRNLFTLFKLPLATIFNRPLHFIQWLLISIGFGLLPFWFAVLRNIDDPTSFASVNLYFWQKGLAMYSIAILANGLSATFLTSKTGMSDNAIGIKAIANTICIILLLLNTGLLFIKPQMGIFTNINLFQIGFFVFSIFASSYVYCFRESGWEESAASFKAADDNAKDSLSDQVTNITSDQGGNKL